MTCATAGTPVAPTPSRTPRPLASAQIVGIANRAEADDSVVREIEDALRIAERSGDDLAWPTPGWRWALRWCTATRMRSVTADRSSWRRPAT